MSEEIEYVIGVDIGGTFTDAVGIDSRGRVYYAGVYSGKAFTTPRELVDGVIQCLRDLSAEMKKPLDEVLSRTRALTHGTTVGTNTIIMRTGARVGLIITKGFEDTPKIQRVYGRVAGLRPDEIKHMAVARKPQPLVPTELVRGVTERIDFAGDVIIPLNEGEARRAIEGLVEEKKVQALAVCLLWSFVNPAHELRIKQLAKEIAPGVSVSTSHEIMPRIRENARMNTTIMDAYIEPTMRAYLTDLNQRVRALGFKHNIHVMQCFGGAALVNEVRSVFTIDSGLVGGVAGITYLAGQLGLENVVGVDMGGTSFDVTVLPHRKPSVYRHIYGSGAIIGRFETLLPKLDVRVIGAGGGSIAWFDDIAGALKVGPMSAQADPGPACYGRDGVEPTVTDADVVLGYVDPNYFLGGRFRLKPELAHKAIREKLADRLGWDVVKTAWGVYNVVCNNSADLIRSLVLQKGYDPSEFTVCAFGGAGPVHAIYFTKPTGIKKIVLMGPAASAFSAFGMATANIMRRYTISRIMVEPFDADSINGLFEKMEKESVADLLREGFAREDILLSHSLEARFREQVNEVVMETSGRWSDEYAKGQFKKYFIRTYETLYGKGSAWEEVPIEILSFNLEAVGKVPSPSLYEFDYKGPDPNEALKGGRMAYWEKYGDYTKTPVYEHERLAHGNVIEGPAIIEHTKTTFVIPPDSRATVDRFKDLQIELVSK